MRRSRTASPRISRPVAALSLALVLSVLPGLLSAQAGEAASEPSSDPAAVERIETWIDALGGMEPYWNLSTARYTLTTEMYDDQSGRLRRTRPRYVTVARTEAGELARIERWEGDDFIAQGWDGEEPWATLNGEPLGPGDKDYDEVTYVASDVNYWIALPWKLTDPGVFLHDDGMDDEGRRVIRVTFGEDVGDHQDTWRYFFEEGRTWPVEIQYVEEGKTSVNRTRWEDIREVDGYIFVGRRVHFNEDGVTKVLFTHDMEINPEIDPSIFSTP